jgi:hypothetical protein
MSLLLQSTQPSSGVSATGVVVGVAVHAPVPVVALVLLLFPKPPKLVAPPTPLFPLAVSPPSVLVALLPVVAVAVVTALPVVALALVLVIVPPSGTGPVVTVSVEADASSLLPVVVTVVALLAPLVVVPVLTVAVSVSVPVSVVASLVKAAVTAEATPGSWASVAQACTARAPTTPAPESSSKRKFLVTL